MHRPALLFLFVLFASTSALALPSATWVISVGNNAGDPDEVTLHYAERDAERMARALRRHGSVIGARARVLTGEGPTALRDVLAGVEQQIAAVPPGEPSALVVYYSGHADEDALHLGGEALPIDELRRRVKASKARVKLLIVDACRSGAITRVKGVRRTRDFTVDLVDRVAAEGMAVITSSTAGENSQESDRLEGSFFSHHLLNALRGAADRDGDSQITLAEAYGYAYDQTVRSSGRTLAVQHPTYAYDVKGRGDLVLTRVAARPGGTASITLGPAVDYLVSEADTGAVVAELRPRREGALLALAPRRYVVQRRDPEEYREYAVTLRAGESVSLAGAPFRSVRYDRLVRRRGGTKRVVHGLRLLAGARGELLDGEGVSPALTLGYGVDLPVLSVGLRLRGALAGEDRLFERRRTELAAGLSIERVTDLPAFSLSFGLLAEVLWHRQQFESDRDAPDVTAIGGAFSGLVAIERALFGGASLRIEGGPSTVLVPVAVVVDGAPAGERLEAVFTGRAAAGLVWRL